MKVITQTKYDRYGYQILLEDILSGQQSAMNFHICLTQTSQKYLLHK